MNYEFKLPDIGEGLTEGEVTKWHVKEGDSIKENQPLCNVLTDKAEVEIPSPKTGKISKLFAKVGEKVKVHGPLVTFELDGGGAPAAAKPTQQQAAASATHAAVNRPSASTGTATVSATPAVRRLAVDLKVDLSKVNGTGPGGRVTEADVKAAASGAGATATASKSAPAQNQTKAPDAPTETAKPAAKTVSSAPAGAEERVPFVGIRRRTAEKMALSARTVAAVTHMDEADVTALVALREELKPEAAKKGVKLTFLPFIIKALAKTLPQFPNLNATLDEAGAAIVRKNYVNCGIAVQAETGLIVPVIKGCDSKDVWTLASELNRLSEKVRAGKVEVSELQGGTITITSIGSIGGLFATPIVNHPEVAILGVMKVQKRPVVRDGGIHVRDMVNLVLSFDHRVVDGAEAAHFMNALVKHLENPRTLL